MIQNLHIEAADLRSLEELAEAAWPLEACALLEGTRDGGPAAFTVTVTRVHPAGNVAERPAREFEADPRVLFRLHRDLRDGPTELVGVWHSHPDGSAELSATDRARAWDSALVWLLTPVIDRRAAATSAFRVMGAGAGAGEGEAASFAPISIAARG